ncbi:hypothetical protein MJG53_005847 [Ovis ammon polii x Ovis aries]|uniref:Uncharacterized protein n=1 Tax=Ovis ammon polii x Ovis aries TaxID=2918886 RepID=A0ACB9V7A8_9CETA|nr:hypothetical protein MJG53_005847 [Ovis ammon polii x Ovis aries]
MRLPFQRTQFWVLPAGKCQAASAQERPRGATPCPRSGQQLRRATTHLRSGEAAKRSNPTSKEQPLHGRRGAKRSYSTFKVRRGSREEIPLIQGKEQQLCFPGAAVKRYPTSQNNRMISVRFQGKPFNITVIQAYAPTSNAEEAEVEWFCEDLQNLLELTPKKDVLLLIGDWNEKVGNQETPGVTGKFGIGEWNEAGQRLIEFCQEHTGHSKHLLPRTEEKTLHVDITRWSAPKSD